MRDTILYSKSPSFQLAAGAVDSAIAEPKLAGRVGTFGTYGIARADF
jgi:hypothetical protein